MDDFNKFISDNKIIGGVIFLIVAYLIKKGINDDAILKKIGK